MCDMQDIIGPMCAESDAFVGGADTFAYVHPCMYVPCYYYLWGNRTDIGNNTGNVIGNPIGDLQGIL